MIYPMPASTFVLLLQLVRIDEPDWLFSELITDDHRWLEQAGLVKIKPGPTVSTFLIESTPLGVEISLQPERYRQAKANAGSPLNQNQQPALPGIIK